MMNLFMLHQSGIRVGYSLKVKLNLFVLLVMLYSVNKIMCLASNIPLIRVVFERGMVMTLLWLIWYTFYRVYGRCLTKMPLIGTCHHFRRQGMCLYLVNAIEQVFYSHFLEDTCIIPMARMFYYIIEFSYLIT